MPAQEFDPSDLGRIIKQHRERTGDPCVSILIGAGFSVSAGIPLASEIVQSIKESGDLLPGGHQEAPEGTSEYQHVMRHLAGPQERAYHIRLAVEKARHKPTNLYRIN